MTLSRWPLAVFAVLALAFSGCSDSTGPVGSGDGVGDFEGQIDPTGQTFTLKSLDVLPPDGIPVRVELIGRFVRAKDDTGDFTLAVAVRNADRRNLYAPAEIALSRFVPQTVYPANPDWTVCPDCPECVDDRFAPPACAFGYVYSELLGNDGILSPGETSGEKLWTFHDPDMAPFSFFAHARFGMEPDRPEIGGMIFHDWNANGMRDSTDGPFVGTSVHVSGNGLNRTVQVGLDGRYAVHVPSPGLYKVEAFPPPTIFAPIQFTTPNPLEVLILPDGQSFLDADFGINTGNVSACPPVLIADEADSLRLDPYSLIQAELVEQSLKLTVGFSGCSPNHPLHLYMVGGVMESLPPQVRVVLSHSSRGELCQAYFTRDVCFNLTPLLDIAQYHTVIVHLDQPDGQRLTFELKR